MATLIRTTGFNAFDAGTAGGRLAFTLSNGNAIVIMRDINNAAGAGGDNTGVEKIYVYESTDRITWTLRATIAIPTATYRISAALYPDDSIALFHESSVRTTVRFCKITYSGWTVGAWELIRTAPANYTMQQMDGAVSDAGVPYLSIIETTATGNGAAQFRVFTRRTSDSTWFLSWTVSQIGVTAGLAPSIGCLDVSICVLDTYSGSRKIVMCFGYGYNDSIWGDAGVSILTATINESTGAMTNEVYCDFERQQGDALKSSSRRQGRHIKVFRSATTEFTIGVMYSEMGRRYYIYRGIWGNETFPQIKVDWTYLNSGYSAANIADGHMAMTYSKDTVAYHFAVVSVSGSAKRNIISYYHRIIPAATPYVITAGHFKWNGLSSITDSTLLLGGGDRNLTLSKHELGFIAGTSATNQALYHQYAVVPRAPVQVKPGTGATMTDSNPSLAVDADVDMKYYQSNVRIRWQFAKDTLFTTNLNDYTQDFSKRVSVEGTDVAGVATRVDDILPLQIYTLPQGTWYVRAAMVNDYDEQGPWTTTNTFTISHPPAAINLSPTGNVQFVYGTGSRQFTWKYTDPSVTDYQTAYSIEVYNFTDSVIAYSSGKLTSGSAAHTATLAAGLKDKSLGWRVMVWDRDDVASAWSSYAMFTLADPPTPTITTPANGGVVTSGVPAITFTPTVGGTRRIVKYVVNVTQGGVLIWSSGSVTVNVVSGTPITVTADRSYLKNTSAYSVSVTVTDSTGLEGTSVPWGFTTAWIPPAAPTAVVIDPSQYNIEDAGYISISWADAARDADFAGWVIYRKDDLIDPNTKAVLAEGDWEEIYREFSTNVLGYVYKDFLAPSGYKVSYRVTQNVNRFGDEVESEEFVTNLLTNSSFEIALVGLQGVYGSVTQARVTDKSKFGTTSLKLTSTISQTIFGTTHRADVKEGKEYMISAYFNSSVVAGKINYLWQNAALAQVGTTQSVVPTAPADGNWNRLSVLSQVAPAGAVYLVVRYYFQNGVATAGIDGWLDGEMITEGNILWDYFDGSMVGYKFTGTAHNSTSVKIGEFTNYQTVYPVSDSYWLVQPQTIDEAAEAFRLAQVVSDSYTDEYETAEYTVIGRGRHVDQGERLGYKGSLTAQLRDSVGRSARMKKKRLEEIKNEPRVLYLRNPFGDTYRVAVGDMAVSRLAGVGLSEFVDVEIPYSEVGA